MESNLETLLFERTPPIALISFHRPQVLNAMNAAFWNELEPLLHRLKEDDEIKAVVFTGVGRAFSTGADLKESRSRSFEEYQNYLEKLQRLSLFLLRYPKPTIAAINGYALGSGFEFALACDYRLASHEAQMGFPEAKVTASITGAGSRLLSELIGPARAKDLLFSAEYLQGKEAAEIGLINESVLPEALIERARERALTYAANSALSIRLMKEVIQFSAEPHPIEKVLEKEVQACLAAVSSEERKERLAEFADRKKAPQEG